MKILRRTGGGLLWVVAAFGALSGMLFVAHLVGWVQPLVVVSGSMQPEISRGDLLIAMPVEVDDVGVGEVTTLPSAASGTLVTHRVTSVSRDGPDYLIEMAGDANQVTDPEPYRVDVGSTVLQPVLTIPAVGDVMLLLARPAVAIPLAIALLALIGLSVVPPPAPARHVVTAEERT
jgi:signal peptidase